MVGAALHIALLLTMAVASGWTWGKLSVVFVWVGMALFEQRRGPSRGTHWTAPATGAAWLVLSALVLCSSTDSSAAAGLLGSFLMTFGVCLRGAAILTLGDGYSDGVRPAVPRVRDGVYTYLDHPGELGAFTLAIGASLVVGSSWALAMSLVVLLPLTLYRFRLEERFLPRRGAAGESRDALAV